MFVWSTPSAIVTGHLRDNVITGGGVGITDFLELLANWGPCP